MAALKATHPQTSPIPAAPPPQGELAPMPGADGAVRLAGEADGAIASPARRLQNQLEFNLAVPGSATDAPRRLPPLATLLLAGVPSALGWWGVFALGHMAVDLLRR